MEALFHARIPQNQNSMLGFHALAEINPRVQEIPSIDPMIGTRAWILCMDPVHGTQAWNPCMDPVHGTLTWIPCMNTVHGSRAWIP